MSNLFEPAMLVLAFQIITIGGIASLVLTLAMAFYRSRNDPTEEQRIRYLYRMVGIRDEEEKEGE